jgi:predicted GNAT family N-acyltransferase
MNSSFQVQPVDVALVRPLRHAMLRAGRPPVDSEYAQDHLGQTVHLAVQVDEDVVVGCLTLFPERFHDESAWRIRGMAVHPKWQRQGLGQKLVTAAKDRVRARGDSVIWCNARVGALDFYRSAGFEVIGPEFLSEEVPHRVAVWRPTAEN